MESIHNLLQRDKDIVRYYVYTPKGVQTLGGEGANGGLTAPVPGLGDL